ncbi:MAG: hypothetical protein A2888_00990 [Chlamydiae bacterium RIFCSPLOWO2_01_FULL_28_7]|nr:MAG: hypothetical protein A2888_00990 [Chlamydiae bacterium RIFCSPLOWO2_01_FULL_28_7]
MSSKSIGPDCSLSIKDFYQIVFNKETISLSQNCINRLDKARSFIDFILKNNLKVYAISTGLADLRDTFVSPDKARLLSKSLIQSHDAGIGSCMDLNIIRGAMLIRANSLSKGHSGFSKEGLQTLLDMLNNDIIPEIPESGSLGASGDLAYFARLGRAMMADEVIVWHKGEKKIAKIALAQCNIIPFDPQAKEGLALLNGTSFMASMLSIAYIKELHEFENMLALQSLFLSSVRGIDTAFNECIQNVRGHQGQSQIASIISKGIENSPFINKDGVQDDYCIRCIPQIFGSKAQIILGQKSVIANELNAATDNPLLFCNDEISSDVSACKRFIHGSDNWAILSGGNFHGENIATTADCIVTANAKLALTLERQISFLLNSNRNKKILPTYLIPDLAEIGVNSGFMITQYVANALTQKICQLGVPTSIFNITSANESEDIVSYGATACQRLLEQLEYIEQLNTIYFTALMQAYSIARKNIDLKNHKNILSEKIFELAQNEMKEKAFPIISDTAFDEYYSRINLILNSVNLRKLINFPLSNFLNIEEISILLSNRNNFKKQFLGVK